MVARQSHFSLFLGNSNASLKTMFLVSALKFFAFGVVSAVLGGFLTYVAQRIHLGAIIKTGGSSKAGFWVGNIGVVFVLASIGLFAIGVYQASCAF